MPYWITYRCCLPPGKGDIPANSRTAASLIRFVTRTNKTRQSQTADSAPGAATWELSAGKVGPYFHWPAAGITAQCTPFIAKPKAALS